MMKEHTMLVEHTTNDVAGLDAAVLAGGRKITQHTEQLRARLGQLERLSTHAPQRVQQTLEEVHYLLSQGLSCSYLLTQLEQHHVLYEHTLVYDHLLLHDLRTALEPLQQWFARYPKERSEQLSWLDWFSQFPSPHDGALFFSLLSQESIATVDVQWMKRLLNAKNGLFAHYAQQGTLKTLLHCIVQCQQIPLNVHAWLEPVIIEALNTKVAASVLVRALRFLLEQAPELLISNTYLLTLWWRFVLANTFDDEVLSISLLHLCNNSAIAHQHVLTLLKGAQKKERSIEQWHNAIKYLHTLNLFPKLWRSRVERHTIAQFGDAYFDTVNLAYINNLKKIACIVQQDESWGSVPEREQDALLILLRHSQAEQWVSTLVSLKKLTCEYTLLSYASIIECAAAHPQPQKYLEAVEKGIDAWSALSQERQVLIAQLIYHDVRNASTCIRAFAFLSFFEYLLEHGVVEHAAIRAHYAVWQQKPWCSATQFMEQVKDSLNLQKKYPALKKEVINDIVSASRDKKQFLKEFVMPQLSQSAEIECVWTALKKQDALNNRASLQQLVALQKKVTHASDEQLFAALNFDDKTQHSFRRDMLRGFVQKELHLDEKKKERWWLFYYQALAQWLGAINTDSSIVLDNHHHRRAIQSLDKIVYAVDDLSVICHSEAIAKSACISTTLRAQLQAYRCSYNASWWRSYDRRVLADKTLFSLLNGANISYTTLCSSLIEVMDKVLTQDAPYTKRNSKGYSRLYDICIQLLSLTIRDVLTYDSGQYKEHLIHIKQLLNQHQLLINNLDLTVPAFQQMHELIRAMDSPNINANAISLGLQ